MASFQIARPAMKPDAPPSSHETRSTSWNSANATPADSTAHGPCTVSAIRRHPLAEPGYSSFSRSGPISSSLRAASTIEVLTLLRRQGFLAGELVDQILHHRRDPGSAAVLDDRADHVQHLLGQVRVTGQVRAAGPQLHQELHRVTTEIADPRGVLLRRPRGTRLAVVVATGLRFRGDEQAAVTGQRTRLQHRGDTDRRVEKDSAGRRRECPRDVHLGRPHRLGRRGLVDGGEHPAQRVALVHRDDREHALVARDRVQARCGHGGHALLLARHDWRGGWGLEGGPAQRIRRRSGTHPGCRRRPMPRTGPRRARRAEPATRTAALAAGGSWRHGHWPSVSTRRRPPRPGAGRRRRSCPATGSR